MLKANYHTHTYLCGHAVGKVEDYVNEAVRLGFKEIGMSDHAHTPENFMSAFDYERNNLKQIMTDEEFETIYVPEVNECKKNNKIKVYLGLETEYFQNHHEYFVDLRKKVDYLLLGLHFFYYNGRMYSTYEDMNGETVKYYTDVAIKAMESKLYTIFAHPDLFMSDYNSRKGRRVFDEVCVECSKKIIDAAIKNDIYLEINANGIHNSYVYNPDDKIYLYPREEFWELARNTGVKIVIGADAHEPKALGNDTVKSALDFAKNVGVELCDFVKLKQNV